jgi:nicotinate-nucleotide adenylyltransferase
MAQTAPASAQMHRKPLLSFYRVAPAGVGMASGERRLGVFSGAFNPITLAHVGLAESALAHYRLHEVLFLLPITQPHKRIEDAPIDARLAMLALTGQHHPAFTIASCTHGLFIDIARAVELAYPPATHLWFITGRDAAERILTWPYPDPRQALSDLFARAELLVADREGQFVLPEAPAVRAHAAQIHHLPLPSAYNHVSATEIRTRLAHGEDVSDLVPSAVLIYIRAHGLYQGRSSSSIGSRG